jgi:enoyl-CoA hydratase
MSGIHTITHENGVAEVVVKCPPVNALTVAGWFELARQVTDAGKTARCVILRAEGRGFNAGVDIKEMQATEGHSALIGANRGCYAAFKAVYECEVPVICAVHGYCLGGGIGLVGNADIIVAAEATRFGLPEVERGALGAATHLARLVPQHKMRAMVYTGAWASAEQLHGWGSVETVVPIEDLESAAMDLAKVIASRRPRVIRAAKHCLNGIDPIDVNRSYRYEQGYTYELNLEGEGDAAREESIEKGFKASNPSDSSTS